MRSRIHLILIIAILMIIGHSISASDPHMVLKQEKHIEVSMRMIGHQVLLSAGDSTSVVLPVERNGIQYKIRFGSEFGFDPEHVTPRIDSVMRATGISENYIVEFVSCGSGEVVHSYEIGQDNDILACQGRAQATSCYELWITLLDQESSDVHFAAEQVQNKSEEAKMDSGLLFILVALIVIFIGLVIFLRNRKSSVSEHSDIVRLGEFKFNKKSMELQFKDDKVELTGKEADLLDLLSTSANITVERDDILRKVWGDEGDYVGRTLDVFVSRLRKKLELDANVRIVNIRGVGYKLILGS
ncbi:MAG: response regulator transcription factor [Flavobacteriales bacterium]|nr:response regulator transcription factor [Flavobacteriales bacterium]NNK81260.1 response regulator transcription factor [Flavobacteriales bacterium]